MVCTGTWDSYSAPHWLKHHPMGRVCTCSRGKHSWQGGLQLISLRWVDRAIVMVAALTLLSSNLPLYNKTISVVPTLVEY